MALVKAKTFARIISLVRTEWLTRPHSKFERGQKAGVLNPLKITVLFNRPLQSLMNPQAVARDVFGFVDVAAMNPKIHVEARYATK